MDKMGWDGYRDAQDYSAESGLSEQERLRMQFMSPFVAHKDVHYVHSQVCSRYGMVLLLVYMLTNQRGETIRVCSRLYR